MHVVTEEDRREVAEGLRDEVGCGSSWPGIERLGLILGIKREPRTGWEGRILTRLADLIYPGDMSQGRRDIVACDRDALLALADEMLSVSIGISSADSIGPLEAAYIVQGYARRIRKALGVDDGR